MKVKVVARSRKVTERSRSDFAVEAHVDLLQLQRQATLLSEFVVFKMTVKLQQKHHRKRYEIITPYLVGMATVTLPTQTLRH